MDTISILKSILGGNATGSSRVDEIQKRPSSGGQPGGSLSDILGSVLGGAAAGGGAQASPGNPKDLGSQLEDLLGVGKAGSRQAAPTPAAKPSSNPIPGLNSTRRPPSREPEPDPAATLIRAMCNAAKVDGDIDRSEQQAILDRIGGVGKEEIEFVRNELNAPLDIEAFSDSVPDSLAQQTYSFSVLGIKLDNLSEAAYLGRLGANLGLDPKTCNAIHKKLGAPNLYADVS